MARVGSGGWRQGGRPISSDAGVRARASQGARASEGAGQSSGSRGAPGLRADDGFAPMTASRR